MESDGRMWTLAQTRMWVCNALGNFATPDEIHAIIDDFDYRPSNRERTMFEGFMRLRLPSLRDEGGEIVEEPSRFIEPALSLRWGDAEQKITRAVRDGPLSLFGRPRDGSRIELISRRDCQLIQFKEDEITYAEYPDVPIGKRSHAPLPYWDSLRLEARKVIELWPHPDAVAPVGDEMEVVRTGAPGRPSGMYLVHAEAKRRRESSETLKPCTDEAEALHAWYKQRWPGGPRLSAKAIENAIRKDHRTYWDGRPQN